MVSGRLETYTPPASAYVNDWVRNTTSGNPLTFAFDGVLVTLTGAVTSPAANTYGTEIFAAGTNPWPPTDRVGGSLERFTGTAGDGAVSRNILVQPDGSVVGYDVTTAATGLHANMVWRLV